MYAFEKHDSTKKIDKQCYETIFKFNNVYKLFTVNITENSGSKFTTRGP